LTDCAIQPYEEAVEHWLHGLGSYTDGILEKYYRKEQKRMPTCCLDLMFSRWLDEISVVHASVSRGHHYMFCRMRYIGHALTIGHYIGIFILTSTVMAGFGLAVAAISWTMKDKGPELVYVEGVPYVQDKHGNLMRAEVPSTESYQRPTKVTKSKVKKILKKQHHHNMKMVHAKGKEEKIVPQNFQVATSTINCYTRVAQNIYHLVTETDGRVSNIAMLFLGGGRYATASHMFFKPFDRAVISCKPLGEFPTGGYKILAFEDFVNTRIMNYEVDGKVFKCDLVLGYLRNGFMSIGVHHQKISDLLAPHSELMKVTEMSMIHRFTKTNLISDPHPCKYTNQDATVRWTSFDENGRKILPPKVCTFTPTIQIYAGDSEPGDCGKPYVAYSRTLNRPMITGIHTAGCDIQMTAAPLCREIYEKWFNSIPIQDQQSLQIPKLSQEALDYSKISKELPGVESSFGTTKFFAGTGGTNIAMSPLITQNDDTKFDIKVAPAIRMETLGDEGIRSPWKTNDTKRVCSNTPPPPKNFFNVLKNDTGYFYKSLFRQKIARARKPLTIEDVIFGCDYCESMATAPSSGWFGLCIKELSKRKSLWDKEKRWIHPALIAAVNELRDLAKKGLPFTVALQCLKDELLPLEDIAKGKVRAFAVGDIVTYVAVAMEYGMAAYDLKANMDGPFLYHYNPHSHHTERLAKRFAKPGRVTGEDASANDCTSVDFLAFAMCYSIATGYYGYKEGSEDYFRCINLGMTVVWFWWLRGGSLHFNFRGMGSGHFLTSLFNSYSHWIMRKWAFNHKYPLDLFEKYVDYVGHGDDNESVVDPAASEYHMAYLCQFLFDTFGFVLTGPDKKPIKEEYHTDEFHFEFLSRTFAHLECPTSEGNIKYIVHKLKFDSIIGMICFYKTGNEMTVSEAVNQNLDMACMELVYYGEETYNQVMDEVRRLAANVDFVVEIKPFSYFFTRWQNHYFGDDPPVIRCPTMMADEPCNL
jgi:hypothetical protein